MSLRGCIARPFKVNLYELDATVPDFTFYLLSFVYIYYVPFLILHKYFCLMVLI